MNERTCRAPGCAKPTKKRDTLCSMHRARWSRHQTFDRVGRIVPLDGSIEAKVIRAEQGCWEWSGAHDSKGYAKLRRGTQNIPIHRWMYEHHVAPLVDGMVIDHACRNPGCVRPDHLRQISVKENVEHFTTSLRSHNTSGYRGVSFHKPSGLWTARVKSGGVVRMTYHKTKEEAADAAVELRLAMHTHNDLDRASA